MFLSPFINNHELVLKKIGLGSVVHRWGTSIAHIPQYIQTNDFTEILIQIEKTITQTRETLKARKMMNSLIAKHAVIHFSNLSERAKRIIRSNFVLDTELVNGVQKIIPDFPKDFFNS